jgi:hypothetical protein
MPAAIGPVPAQRKSKPDAIKNASIDGRTFAEGIYLFDDGRRLPLMIAMTARHG